MVDGPLDLDHLLWANWTDAARDGTSRYEQSSGSGTRQHLPDWEGSNMVCLDPSGHVYNHVAGRQDTSSAQGDSSLDHASRRHMLGIDRELGCEAGPLLVVDCRIRCHLRRNLRSSQRSEQSRSYIGLDSE